MRNKKLMAVPLLLVVTAVGGILGYRWIEFRLTHAITNAVFVESDTFTKVAYKRVGGKIEELFKEEGDPVEAGEPLAKLEDRDYRVKLQELEESINSLRKEKESLKIKLKASRAQIEAKIKALKRRREALQKEIEANVAVLEQMSRDMERLKDLYNKGVVPLKKFEDVETEVKAQKRKIEALEKNRESISFEIRRLRAKLEELKSLKKKIEAIDSRIRSMNRRREDLKRMLEETVLKSPIRGYVVKRFVNLGEVVRPGQFIYALYDPEDVYILVLLEETKIEGVREGNRAYIKIDAFPEVEFEGVVESIGKAVASKFAVIPRDVTAGEFTKVAQRIPVKIRLTKGPKHLLKVGMGGEVAIELKN